MSRRESILVKDNEPDKVYLKLANNDELLSAQQHGRGNSSRNLLVVQHKPSTDMIAFNYFMHGDKDQYTPA